MTGDAANADPVCDLSPHHHLVTEAVERAERPRPADTAKPAVEKPLVFRSPTNSAALFPPSPTGS
jgi:pyrroloquinoline quinone biosynthesis protein E